MARKNCSDIGGQAVLEGVMMRGTGAEAVAVRDPRGVIQLESRRLESKKPLVKRIPVVRGVAAFVQSFVDGTKILIRSGEVYGEGNDYYEDRCGFYDIRDICRIDPNIAKFLELPYGTAWMQDDEGKWHELTDEDEQGGIVNGQRNDHYLS